jgi:hypothetical protein
MTLERGKKVEKGIVSGAVAYFLPTRWLWSGLLALFAGK